MKFVAKLAGFKQFKDLRATLLSRKGDLIIGEPIEKKDVFNGKFYFEFDQDELLSLKRRKGKVRLKLKIESLNGRDDYNLEDKSGIGCSSLSPQKQRFGFELKRASRRKTKSFDIRGESVDCIPFDFKPVGIDIDDVDLTPDASTYKDPVYQADQNGYLYNSLY